MEEPTRAPRCSTCGTVLSANASAMCAACAFDACADATSMPVSDSSSRLPLVGRIAGLAADRRGELGEDVGTETTILQFGQTFGPYRIGRLLGRGGMGEVYEAEHLAHCRRVALKVLNQRLRRADDRERFLQEGQLAAAVNHPNTVYIFSSEELDDQPVITMELLPGGKVGRYDAARDAYDSVVLFDHSRVPSSALPVLEGDHFAGSDRARLSTSGAADVAATV